MFAAGPSLGDQVDERLPNTLPPDLKANVRQMISIGMDDDDTIDLINGMVQHRFEVPQILQAQQIIIKSHRSGLPTHPISNKAYEGISKQVAAGTIVAAMEQVYSRYAFAYEQVGMIAQQGVQTSELGNLMASSLAAGIGRNDARAIIAALDSRSQSLSHTQSNHLALESLSAMRDIARLGVSSQAATSVMVQALDKGLTANDIAVMHASFITQSKHTPPERLAKNYSQAILNGKSIHSFGAKEGTQTGRQGSPAGFGGAGSGANGGGSGGGAGGGAGGGSGGGGSGGGAGGGGSGGAGGSGR
ncbi:hypothetical protein ACFL5W_00250 [Thermodesulfobacteriota bacterium]